MGPAANPEPVTADAATLIAFVKSLGCSAGFEPSCKISTDGVDDRRFLLSLGSEPWIVRATSRFVSDMAMPEEARAAFETEARSAAFIHLGYEEAREVPRFKVYCERKAADGRPLYTAWKWSPGKASSLSTDDYWLGDGGHALILDAFGAGCAQLSAACIDLYDRTSEAGEAPMLLQVQRRGAARRSFDLGLYDARLPIDAGTPLVTAAERAFGLPDLVSHVASFAGDAQLGHVTGGRDDGGAAFVTLYFGARELR